jgi:hypothetical protein
MVKRESLLEAGCRLNSSPHTGDQSFQFFVVWGALLSRQPLSGRLLFPLSTARSFRRDL